MTADDRWNQRSSDLAAQVRSLVEAVDDLSYDLLREATRRREGRPSADKTLMQIRRSLEKAAHLLEGFDHRSGAADDE
ncbi:MAG: hypothetical protein ACO3SP_00240 [Ilumatobacteraceae bacterium]